MRQWLAAGLLALGLAASAQGAAYDETADAPGEVRAALSAARQSHRKVLLIFGANWCPDCRALDASLSSARNAPLIGREFQVVKIDVGRFDKNLELTAHYGNPTQKGIPAAVIVSADDQVLYSTKAGELADARQIDDDGIYRFFDHVLAGLKAR